MKILVPVKRVVDHHVQVRAKADGSGVALENLKMSINPFDEIALEQALRLKEAGQASEVIVVACGEAKTQDTLRHALAMGADRAILVEAGELSSLQVAKILRAIVLQEQVQLVLAGKQSIDQDNGQTPQMLAALLNWAQATCVSKLDLQAEQLRASREIENGIEVLAFNLPAVVSVDLRLNEPRFVSLPNLMKAKKKPLEILNNEALGVSLPNGLRVLKVSEPAKRSAGIRVNSVAELAQHIRAAL